MIQLVPMVSCRAFVIVALALTFAGCESGGPTPGSLADVPVTVRMTSGFTFEPRQVHVKSGGVVEWRNMSTLAHSVTDDPQKDPKLTALPAGAASFDSGLIPAGQIFRQTFTVLGTYRYKCVVHDGQGMTGEVIVDPR
jgi:plastocyanin